MDMPSQKVIADWTRRVSDARVRVTSEMRALDDVSPLQREGQALLDELTLAFEELQVAEEELRVQTDELTTSREMLELERAHYRALFELAPVAYFVTDAQGVIRHANRAASALLRVRQNGLRGKPIAVFVPERTRRRFRDRLSTLESARSDIRLRLRLRARDRKLLSVAATIGIVRERKGAIAELRWLVVDDAARRRGERRARSMNEMLAARVEERTAQLVQAMEKQQELASVADTARRLAENASREKTELIATVSHEVRTPLAAIGGYAELLLLGARGPLLEAQRTDVLRIQEAQAYILRLVDDLVAYSKFETGYLRFDIGDVIVGDTIDRIVAFVAPQAAAKNVSLRILTPGSDVIARADEERLRQIVLNLLSNAIKFTPVDGSVSISFTAEGRQVYVVVSDNGVGIPPDKLEAVFEPHVRLLSSSARHEAGWGLGLAISRNLARGMGGDLTASSENVGATFTLQLPRSTRIAPEASRGRLHERGGAFNNGPLCFRGTSSSLAHPRVAWRQ